MIDSPAFADWKAEGMHRSLLKQLGVRFPGVLADVEEELREVYNLESLDRLAETVLVAPDLATFRATLQSLPKE